MSALKPPPKLGITVPDDQPLKRIESAPVVWTDEQRKAFTKWAKADG